MTRFLSRLLYPHPGPFLPGWKERFRFAIGVVVLILASDWLGHNFLVEPPAKWYHDFQLRRRSLAQERVTRIVHIDADDHERLFGGRSPLPGAAVVHAACALAGRGAAVVVVDLDTSSERMYPDGLRLPDSPVPIIWAVDLGRKPDGTEQVGRPLGGKLPKQPPYGISVMPADFDGVIRHWKQNEVVKSYERPTLPWAGVQALCRSDGRCSAHDDVRDDHPPVFTTRFAFQDIRLSEFVTQPAKDFPSSCPVSAPDPRLTGRIVVLGGSYSEADLHETPWGTLRGVELVAMAIEQVFDPAPFHQLADYAKVGLEVVLALLIGAIHHWIRPIPATVLTLAFLPLSIIVSAELLFLFGDYEVGIVPFVVGMLVHQLVGSAERTEHLLEMAQHRVDS